MTKLMLEEILSRKDPMEDILEQARFMEDAQVLPDEDEDSPTPGFSFGMRMGCVREDAELSMNKMAKSLGIAPSTWKNYEEDVTFPSTELIMKFCKLYNVNPRWLMTNYGNMYKEKEDAMKLRIALLQLLPGGSLEEQLNIGKTACIKAKDMGADIALFPEMWSDGYFLPQEDGAVDDLAIAKDSDFIVSFCSLAKELQMAIGITFLEKGDPKPLNSMILFDKDGELRLHYSKVHTCAFGDEIVLSPGGDFYVTDLDIGRGMVKIGAMICFDREFPESARILMLKGAEVILAPNACPMEINRLAALRTRAYENKVAIATCNYPKGQPDCNGHSTLFDGVAWLRDEPGVRDMCVFEAPEEEGVYLVDIDMDMLRDYREHEVMGEKYRHPDRYGILADMS